MGGTAWVVAPARIFGLVAAVICLQMPAALAQQANTRAAEPGQVQKRFEAPAVPKAPSAPIAAPRPGAAPVEIEERGQRFVLSSVVIEGTTVFDQAALAPLYEDYLAREISLADVEKILAAITKKYRDAGYFLSQAVAPPQSVGLGILRIRIIEGYVERVELGGADPGRRSLLQAMAGKITAERPLRLATLQRYVLLMNDIAGLSLKADMQPADPDEERFVLKLTVEHDPFAGSAGLDNRGTKPVGPYQAYTSLTANSALGLLETTQFTFYTVPNQPQELLFWDIRQEHVVGTEGTKLLVSASRSRVNAGSDLEDTDLESRGQRYEVQVTHPLIRTREQALYIAGRFYASNSKQEQRGQRNFDDRLRVLGVDARYNFSDDWGGLSLIAVKLAQGLEILNASEAGDTPLSRPRGRGDFTKVGIDLVRRQTISGPWSLMLMASAQKSGATLLSSEEFSVGGSRFGRAYDPSEITGSDGAAGSIELRYAGNVDWPVLDSYELYGFYDFGAVWNDTGDQTDRDSLASTGLGARFGYEGRIFGGVELAKPLTRSVAGEGSDGKDWRIFFRLSANF